MIAFMESHPEKFKELIELAIINEHPYSWRAAWLLFDCMEEDDLRVKPYIKKIINILEQVKDGQKRDLINVLRKMKIEEEQEGLLFDTCIFIWTKTDKIPSVRWSALKLMLQITKKHPDLYHEVLLLTQNEYVETFSPGIGRSIQKLLKDFKKNHLE
jgi:hypothetical protein